jgi:ABC-type dipeptide/oligopeptide/nickel transport system ATPase subunit
MACSNLTAILEHLRMVAQHPVQSLKVFKMVSIQLSEGWEMRERTPPGATAGMRIFTADSMGQFF